MEALDYNREAAERFGYDADIACRCAGLKDHPEMADHFIAKAEKFARIAFHFAARTPAMAEPLSAEALPEFCTYCLRERSVAVKLDVLGACPCCARLGTEVR